MKTVKSSWQEILLEIGKIFSNICLGSGARVDEHLIHLPLLLTDYIYSQKNQLGKIHAKKTKQNKTKTRIKVNRDRKGLRVMRK